MIKIYTTISSNKFNVNNFIDIVLENRNIENKELLLNPSMDSLIHYSKLKNIKKGVYLFKDIVTKNRQPHIAVVPDEDIDGYVSSAILISYIENSFVNTNISTIFHSRKAHGLTKDIMKKICKLNKDNPIDLLIMPDASSNDYEQHKILNNLGIKVLVIDHHLVEKGESKDAVIINPQLSPHYKNKELSGAGVVYKFLQALDDEFNINNADNWKELLSLSLVSDAMDLSSPETRYLVYSGLEEINNKFFKEMIFKHIGDFDKVYPHTLSFNVIPKINAMIRVGKDEEKIDMFKAFLGREEDFYNSRTKKTETLPQKVTRLCNNAYNRQKKLKAKWIDIIKEQIEENNLNDNAFLLVRMNEDFDRELTGYIAGGLVSEYRKPVLILVWNSEQEAYTGSLRGHDRTMENTKDFLIDLDLFDFVQGHQNASGFKIQEEALNKLNDEINKKLSFNSEEKEILVDFILSEDEITVDLIEDVYSYENLWGKGVEMPQFGFEATVDTSNITTSKSSSYLKWFKKGIEFVQFTGDEKLLELAGQNKEVTIKAVGTMGINSFLGRETPQVVINELEIVEIKEKEDDDFDLFDW